MTKDQLDEILTRLRESVNHDNAYFGIVEDVAPHEFCVKANEDGLKLFAAELLDVINNNKERPRNLAGEELPWFDDLIERQYIELTNKSRAELIKPTQDTKSADWRTKLIIWVILIVVVYLIITGIIFTIQLV
ncbi:MAG: hypothetical protein U0289_06170 [Cyclobacteriaceae bacterium]|nr:hypothetical protein [Cytophagales bacterium]HNP77532.1 hypothetical protein [Cyclobacteriaceae bacterium]